MDKLPELRQKRAQYGWAGLLYHFPGMPERLSGNLNIWHRLTESFSFSATFGPLISLGLVVVIGLSLAVTPEPYREGAVALCPPERRALFRRLLEETGETRWLVAQAIAVPFIGVVVSIGLRLMGMPLSLSRSRLPSFWRYYSRP